jgi:hypothetical protein
MRTDTLLVLVTLEDLRIKPLDIGSGFRRSSIEVFPLLDMAWRRLVVGNYHPRWVVGNYQPMFHATSQKLLRLLFLSNNLHYCFINFCIVVQKILEGRQVYYWKNAMLN